MKSTHRDLQVQVAFVLGFHHGLVPAAADVGGLVVAVAAVDDDVGVVVVVQGIPEAKQLLGKTLRM